MKCYCVHRVLSRQFSKLGKIIGSHPIYFFLGPIILCSILSTGIMRLKLNREIDYLFTAQNGRAHLNKKLVENIFKKNTSSFSDIIRRTGNDNTIIIQMLAKDKGNMFREEIFEDIVMIDEYIKNITIERNGRLINYSSICALNNGRCCQDSVLKIAPHIKSIIDGKYKIKYPYHLDGFTFYLTQYIFSLGGVELDEDGNAISIKAVRLSYMFDNTDKSKIEDIKEWINHFNKVIKSINLPHTVLMVLHTYGFFEEIDKFTDGILPKLPVLAAVIIVFAILTCMTNDWVRSKPWLGLSTCVSAFLAIASGFGLGIYFGIESIDANFALIFGVIATEVDDAFVLIAAWRNTNLNDPVEKRMESSYSEAAVSITITSLTSFSSFCIGSSSPFPGVKIFCIYAAIFVCFTYIYQITFFGSCMAFSGYREQKRLHPFICRRVKERKASHSSLPKEEFLMVIFRDKLGSLLMSKSTKVIIIVIFMINLSVSIYGLVNLKTGNDFSDALAFDSELNDIIAFNYKYFGKFLYPVHIIIDRPLNYADPAVQKSIDKTLERFESHPHIAEEALTISWLKYFRFFSNRPLGKFILNGYNISNKLEFIDVLKNVFLKLYQSRQFKEDIIFNENLTEITSTRFLLLVTNISDTETETEVIKQLYEIADTSPLPIKIHGINFHLLEQALIIKQATFQIAIVTSALVCIIFFLFIPNLSNVFCIAIIVFCIIFETIGYMSLWNVKLDMPSLGTLILCVGFSINYPTHISFSFVTAKGLDSNERIKKSLYEVGLPIFQGSTSTILGVTVLAFEPYYGTLCFFKIIFLIALQTAFHAMFVIPIVLNLLSRFDKTLTVKDEQQEKKKNFYLQ
ncbi:patched domain-containing protein 3-like [Centruroides vittatus]|uniref:patched domain-containing protein 3-like n=1 Tax=Centruroides vittatus TaxID=120091 RepID=UPI00350FDB54